MMICKTVLVVLGLTPSLLLAQRPQPVEANRTTINSILGFETSLVPGFSPEWGGDPDGTISTETATGRAGQIVAKLDRSDSSAGTLSTIYTSLPMDFKGKQIELHGALRTENVTGFAGLWAREDSGNKTAAFENMERQQVKGSTGWTNYTITVPIQPDATNLIVGVLLVGKGRLWADDLRLTVDGQPIGLAPAAEPKLTTILDHEHTFDAGSGTQVAALSQIQIANLVTLGRIWGFLKYYDRSVTSGQLHWDYELFRILPQVMSAPSRAKANAVMLRWIDNFDHNLPCRARTNSSTSEVAAQSNLSWLRNRSALGTQLSNRLRGIYLKRSEGAQFYVTLEPEVGNASFDHELSYQSDHFPDSGMQLLGLFRFWNAFEYWAPYRTVAGEDSATVLNEFIPRIMLAKDKNAYQLEMMQLIARAHDTHANLWSSLALRPPAGQCALPINLRFVDKRPMVTSFSSTEKGARSDFEIGDVISEIDGQSVMNLLDNWRPFYADSNNAAQFRDFAQHLPEGPCGTAAVTVIRDGRDLTLKPTRLPFSTLDNIVRNHDLPGDTFQMLSKEVAYIKLSTIKASDIPALLKQADGTRGLIIDLRNYPADFVVFSMGSAFVSKPTPFARFTIPDLANPGTFNWAPPVSLSPGPMHYPGKIVILVDEITQSQAEYTAMAFRAAPNAIVIGSMTAGADGNTSYLSLPGGLHSLISGVGIFYPDKKPTQRVGIVPDITVTPTPAGIKAGRDEVLEAAVREILTTR